VQSVQRLARTRRFGVRSPVEGNFSVLFTCPDRSWGTPSPLFNLCWKFFLRLKRPRLDIELPHHLEPRVSIGRTIPLLSSLRLVCLYTWGAQVFQIHRRHLKIPEARYLSRSKVHTEDPQTLWANEKVCPTVKLAPALCTSLLTTKTSEFNPVCPEEVLNGCQCTEATRNIAYVHYHTVDSVQPTGTSMMGQSLLWPPF